MRRSLWVLLLGMVSAILGADDVLIQGFQLRNASDPRWRESELSHALLAQDRMWAAVPWPQLTLDAVALREWQGKGWDVGSLSESPAATPMALGYYFELPLLNLPYGAEVLALGRELELNTLRWTTFQKSAFRNFLMDLTNGLKAIALLKVKERTAATYRDLHLLALRRQSLGAGTAKETFLAEMAWRRSLVGLEEAQGFRDQVLFLLGDEGLRWFENLPEDTSWRQPEGWESLLSDLGWMGTGVEFSGGYRESPLYQREQDAAGHGLTVRNLGALPRIDFYSSGEFDLQSDNTVVQAGFKLSWPVVSADFRSVGESVSWEIRKEIQESKRAQAQGEYLLADRTFRASVKNRGERREIFKVAEKFGAALQTALAAGTGTLEDVLEGWEIFSAAQEDQIAGEWSTVQAAVDLLWKSGHLVIPGGVGR